MLGESTAAGDDVAQIADIVHAFFAAFTSGPDCVQRLEALKTRFLAGASIVRTCGDEPTLYDVDAFIDPRRRLLTEGALQNFREWELQGNTHVFGDMATHVCHYAKAGVSGGTAFTARGMKSLQLVRTRAGWRISAVVWDDERPGVTWDPAMPASAQD